VSAAGSEDDRRASIDEQLDRVVAAINRGDPATVTELAGQVLAVDGSNAEAEGLLADDVLGACGADGEIRRLTILFADLVDSTELSGVTANRRRRSWNALKGTSAR